MRNVSEAGRANSASQGAGLLRLQGPRGPWPSGADRRAGGGLLHPCHHSGLRPPRDTGLASSEQRPEGDGVAVGCFCPCPWQFLHPGPGAARSLGAASPTGRPVGAHGVQLGRLPLALASPKAPWGDLQGSRGYCWAGPAGGKGRTGQDQGARAEKSLPQRKGGERQRRKCQKREKQVGGRKPTLGAAEAYKGFFYASGN